MGFPRKPHILNYPIVGITFIGDILFYPEYPLDAVTLNSDSSRTQNKSLFTRMLLLHVDFGKPTISVIKEHFFLKKKKEILMSC